MSSFLNKNATFAPKDRLGALSKLPYFTRASIGAETNTTGKTLTTLILREQKKGFVVPLKRGVFTHRDTILRFAKEKDFQPMVATILDPDSYVSREFVLQRYDILSEAVFAVTSVTSGQTKQFHNDLGNFYYYHIKEQLFTGYVFSHFLGVDCAVATKAKALFDYFYHRKIQLWYAKEVDLVEDLRLNMDDWLPGEVEEFYSYVQLSQSPKMQAIFSNLKGTVWSSL